MTQREVLFALLLAYLLITTGTVWLFGPYGLIGSGTLLATVVSFVDVKREEPDDG